MPQFTDYRQRLPGMISRIKRLSQDRGSTSEQYVIEALYRLRDEFGVPIIVIPSLPGSQADHRGVDVEVRGRAPLHLWVGMDVKSSQRGVDGYHEKQAELKERGIRSPYPRYPFLFDHQGGSDLLLELFRFILEHSQSHDHQAARLDPTSLHWIGPEFTANLRWFIDETFNSG